MGDKSRIEWTEATWNPVRGCSRVSKGCENCYAEGVAHRFSGPGQPYEGLTVLRANGDIAWTGEIKLVWEHLKDPLRWQKPRKIFVNSMSDLFHQDVPDYFIDKVFAVMALCPQHIFQILTKRPERMKAYCNSPYRIERIAEAMLSYNESAASGIMGNDTTDHDLPLTNVWLGVSVEDQESADKRIPLLQETIAAVRWISAEPLLEAVDIEAYLRSDLMCARCGYVPVEGMVDYLWLHGDTAACPSCKRSLLIPTLDWVVVGGESGRGARQLNIAWAQSLVDQCTEASTPVFVKQLGPMPFMVAKKSGVVSRLAVSGRKGGHIDEWPASLRVREYPPMSPRQLTCRD